MNEHKVTNEENMMKIISRFDPFQLPNPVGSGSFANAYPFSRWDTSGRMFSRWIPKDYRPLWDAEMNGICYVSEAGGLRFYAMGYAGNAGKRSFHYSYKTAEARDKACSDFFASLKSHKERVRKYRAESYQPHTFKVGDIITNSWGYDQTNVDFYRIVKTSQHYVWIQAIAAHTSETGFMSGKSVPHIDTSATDPTKWGFIDKKEEVERHRASGENVCMKYGSGSKWDGKERYTSWYA